MEKRRLRRETGLETLVDITATTLLIFGVLAAFVWLLFFSLLGLAASIATLLGAMFQWLLLRCLAEHLRLQKKIAGEPFEGEITGPREETIWACGNCQTMLHSETRCDSCGAEIVQDDL